MGLSFVIATLLRKTPGFIGGSVRTGRVRPRFHPTWERRPRPGAVVVTGGVRAGRITPEQNARGPTGLAESARSTGLSHSSSSARTAFPWGPRRPHSYHFQCGHGYVHDHAAGMDTTHPSAMPKM